MPASRYAGLAILVLLASWPGFLVDVCRIGNDVLALTLGSACMLSSFGVLRQGSKLRDWSLAGVILGATLLAKSYMLAIVPLLPLLVVIETRRSRSRLLSSCKGLLIAVSFAVLIAGWWYLKTYRATGTLSGEQLDAASAQFGLMAKLAALHKIKWLRVLDSIATTHIWTGGWSFLGVRSWMYRIFECAAIIAGVGLIALAAQRFQKFLHGTSVCWSGRLLLCVWVYSFFCAGLAYFAVDVYLSAGISTALGWYLYAVFGIEGVLLASGFAGLFGTRRAAGCIAVIAALACAFDLYTMNFVSAPYYAGLTAHSHSGNLTAFDPLLKLRGAGLRDAFARLAINKPFSPLVLVILWVGYLCATCGLLAYSVVTINRVFYPDRKVRRNHSHAV